MSCDGRAEPLWQRLVVVLFEIEHACGRVPEDPFCGAAEWHRGS